MSNLKVDRIQLGENRVLMTSESDPNVLVVREGTAKEPGAELYVLQGDSTVPLGQPMLWPDRESFLSGYIGYDGQEVSVETYPELYQMLIDGKLPTVSEAIWQDEPAQRNKFVITSSDGMFRMPDYNGASEGSLGAITEGGVWAIKAFGAVTNSGTADAAQLATDLANFISSVFGDDIHVLGNISATGDISASGDISATGDISASGEVRANGNVTAYYSDIRLKENVRQISNALEAVCGLEGVRYNANALAESFGYDRAKPEVGLLAHQVQSVMPEAVEPAPFDIDARTGKSKSGENYLTLKYERLVPLLVEAIKEQQAQIQHTRDGLDELRALIQKDK